MHTQRQLLRQILLRWLVTGSMVLGMTAGLLFSRPARAQGSALQALGAFLSVGGYFMTSGSASRALGPNKFYAEGAFLSRPARYGSLRLSGGLEIISAEDHFLPFTSGNGFELYGGVFRLTTPRIMNRVRPIFTGGLYVGHIVSERFQFDVARFAPGFYVGAEYPFARYFTLSAGYRVSQDVNGINLDGFSLALRFF